MNIREQLVEFHDAMGVPIESVPIEPYPARVRLRASLIVEECLELLDACFDAPASVDDIRMKLTALIERAPVMFDMVPAADALADIAYVVEGANLEFGIGSEQVLAEVHRANMAKAGGPVREDGKRLKPPGWKPPDIGAVLRAQGWRG